MRIEKQGAVASVGLTALQLPPGETAALIVCWQTAKRRSSADSATQMIHITLVDLAVDCNELR